ncbi:unnamed protein product [Citrullus colocynthis]|uniref:Terpene synthase metal-binding domain-containing protein n=1 Tax=Citrullus colocynthis TaxID=252529 RepID=A0ABP0YM71_9ROSI
MIASLLDDIYDAYGTFQELQQFTHALERWDENCIEGLPTYMKVCYKALMDIYRDIEQRISKDHNPYAIHYAKEAVHSFLSYIL